MLSQAGQISLVKFVVSLIPLYYIATCQLVASLYHAYDSVAHLFIYNGKNEGRKPMLVAWNLIYKPKSLGGLGIKNFS